MPDPIVYGFPRSTYVNIVRLVLTHKDVPYVFQDLEPVMGKPEHLALHPFNRVPILKHGDFTVYETSAIVAYVDEAFEGARLTPKDVQARARMNQWIGAVNSYYDPYMIYHVTHERLVFPELGIASDEAVVAHALPKVELGLTVVERVQRQVLGLAHHRLEVLEDVRHVLVREHQADDVDIGASWKSVDDRVGHSILLQLAGYMSGQRLVPGEAEVVEQMLVVGDLPEIGELPALLGPEQPPLQQRGP